MFGAHRRRTAWQHALQLYSHENDRVEKSQLFRISVVERETASLSKRPFHIRAADRIPLRIPYKETANTPCRNSVEIPDFCGPAKLRGMYCRNFSNDCADSLSLDIDAVMNYIIPAEVVPSAIFAVWGFYMHACFRAPYRVFAVETNIPEKYIGSVGRGIGDRYTGGCLAFSWQS